MKKRILLLIPQLGYGGAESAFIRLAEELSLTHNVEIAVMATSYGIKSGYALETQSTKLPVVMLEKNRKQRHGRLSKLFRWWRMFRTLRQLKAKNDASISFLSGANLLNALARSSVLTIISERGSKQFDSGMTGWQRWFWTSVLDPIIYRRSRFIVAASKGLADEIATSNPSAASKIFAIEGTVRSEDLLEISEAEVAPGFDVFIDYSTVVGVGRCHVQKGFDLLIDAFADVRKLQCDARLLLIGDGPELLPLRDQAAAAGLRVGTTPNPERFDIVFAGFREKPLRFLRTAKAFAMPSRYEGLPNVMIEALATGVPVLAADCPWGPRSILAEKFEILPDGEVDTAVQLAYGLLLPRVDSPNARAVWANAIHSVLLTEAQRAEVNERRRAIERFDIKKTAKLWRALLDADAGRGINS